jgi:hypothetical protein
MTLLRKAALLGLLLSLGCDNATSPALAVTGTWTHEYQIPGMGFVMTLSMQGRGISGTGTWSGEACCSGTVAVSGAATGGLIELDITQVATAGALVPPIKSHFEGRVILGILSGTITAGDTSTPYSFRRTE